jgi:hypothetical protein
MPVTFAVIECKISLFFAVIQFFFFKELYWVINNYIYNNYTNK